MKRAFAIIALLLMVTYSQAAFAETITLWHSYRGDEQRALETLIEQWNTDNPDAQVVPLAVPHEAYANKITSAIPRGQGPDLFIFAHERIGDWVESGLIAPVNSHIPPDWLSPFLASSVEAFEYRKKLYGIPLAFKSVALIYNREFISSPPKDTDEMMDVMIRLIDYGPGRFGLAYEAGSFYHHAGWLFGFGGELFDEESNITLNTTGAQYSLEFVWGLTKSGLLPKEPSAALVAQLFNEKRTAMVINGPWFLGEIDPSIDYAVAPLPAVSYTGEPASPFLTVEGAILSSKSKHPKSAMAFARYLASGNGAVYRLVHGKQLPADRMAFSAPGIEIDPALYAFYEQAQSARPMPNDPKMRIIWEPAARALRSVLRGSATPEQALTKAQFQIKTLTRKPPEGVDPEPYVAVLFIIVALGLIVAVFRSVRRGDFAGVGRQRHAYLYLMPAAIAMLVLVFVPFIVGTAVAFFAHRNGEFTFVGLSNFVNILLSRDAAVTDPLSFYFTLVVTVMWTVVNVALHVSIGLALAMVLRDKWLKMRGIYRVLLIVPWAVPNYITALIWKSMFHSQFGAINGLLKFFGLEPVSWFSHFWTSFAANVTTNTWLGFPFMMVVALGALQAIPRDLEEAAMMDGAGAWTRFTKVILPQVRPALVPAVILGSVWTFNMFNIIYLVSGGEPDGATEILISEAYRWAFSRQEQYGYAAAYATLIFVVLIGYSMITRRVAGEGEA